MITNLDFADDVLIFAETLEVHMHALDTLIMESEPLGLKVSWIKTKIQKFIAFFEENIDLPHHQLLRKENLSHLLTALCTLGVISAVGDDPSRKLIYV